MATSSSKNLDLHLLPGLFSRACEDFLLRLQAGAGGLRPLQAKKPSGEDPQQALGRLLGLPPGAEAQAVVASRLPGGQPLELSLQTLGTSPEGRSLLGLTLSPQGGGRISIKDLELALLGLALSALSKESQGVALIGHDLGSVGVGPLSGTVAEQALALLAQLGPRIGILVAAPDTAASLGEIPSYVRAPLAGLVEYRLA